MLNLSKSMIEAETGRVAELTSLELKRVPEGGDCYFSGRNYSSRSLEDFLPVLGAISAIREAFRYEGKTKELGEMFVLQIAGGYCQLGPLLDTMGIGHAISDIGLGNLAHGKRSGMETGIGADASAMPFKDASATVVVSDHFLFAGYPTIKSSEALILKEAKRVLKPEGLLVLNRTYFDTKHYDPKPDSKDWAVLYDSYRFAILQKRR